MTAFSISILTSHSSYLHETHRAARRNVNSAGRPHKISLMVKDTDEVKDQVIVVMDSDKGVDRVAAAMDPDKV